MMWPGRVFDPETDDRIERQLNINLDAIHEILDAERQRGQYMAKSLIPGALYGAPAPNLHRVTSRAEHGPRRVSGS